MSTVITKQRLTEIINEELNLVVESTYSKLLTEGNILNLEQTLPAGDETHTMKITDGGGSSKYGIIFNGDLYDIKAYKKGLRFFLRPLTAFSSAAGFNLSFQPRKGRRNWGDPKGGFMEVKKLAGILKSLISDGRWEGTFETLDEDGNVAKVTMIIEKA